MSIPITHCEIRKAIDNKNFLYLKRAMEYNMNWGAFSVFPCKGHWFKKKCEFTKKEKNIIFKNLGICIK